MKKIIVLIAIILPVSMVNAQVQEELTPLEIKQTTVVTQPATLKKGFLRAGFFRVSYLV